MSFYSFFCGFSLPYEIQEQHPDCWGQWEHFQAARLTDQKPFSLFRLTAGPKDTLALEAGKNGVKIVRTVWRALGRARLVQLAVAKPMSF